ncbi:MAG TPA: chemotaxis protein CheB [Terriglobales bacterium]|nr:chemotaxis protein CheB [Terriglobales bacterium]
MSAKTKKNEVAASPGEATNARAAMDQKDEHGDERQFPVAGVGASAGGMEAFMQLLKALPARPGIAFVFIPHLDPSHKSAMTELLARTTTMPVLEVQHGLRLQRDHVYVIPPNYEMTIADNVLYLSARDRGASHYLPVDRFLRSLAADRRSNAIGIILSGTASDGTLGMAAIKSEGGITFAQDSGSAKYDGMPNSAIVSGSVDFVLPPDRIAEELTKIREHPYLAAQVVAGEDEPRTHMEQVFRLLKKTHRVDFTDYKPGTIRRRIQRRMALCHIEQLREYVALLHRSHAELDQLYQDLLINVTSFFRDPAMFEALKERVYPTLLANRSPSDAIRLWVPGCSTGEEVYSHAMALVEFVHGTHSEVPVQIFGTDISQSAIHQARQGIFKESIVADVSPERLRRFFNKADGGYQINKSIRDMCIFALQNVFSDPPFSHMDIVSCRNVLIYLGSALQKRVIPIFHYALKPTGFLIVGNAEGIVGPGAEQLFDLQDRKYKIFRKKLVPSSVVFGTVQERMETYPPLREALMPRQESQPELVKPSDLNREADRFLLSKYVLASVLVSDDLEVLQTRGAASRYLELPSGKATLNLLKLAKPGLLFELQSALDEARRLMAPVRRENVQFEAGNSFVKVNVEVAPLQSPLHPNRGFLLLFEDNVVPRERRAESAPADAVSDVAQLEDPKDAQIAKQKQELEATREYLQSIIEALEASNEELQSANEEIQSGNEELQSTNEELQTSKEELESANEELNTVNEEMRHRNLQLTELHNDLLNVLASVKIAVLILGADLTIRRFTAEAEQLLGLGSIDVGRPISKVRLHLVPRNLEEIMLEAMRDVRAYDYEVKDGDSVSYRVRITPYRTMDNKIDGVIAAFFPTSEGKSGRTARKNKPRRRRKTT